MITYGYFHSFQNPIKQSIQETLFKCSSNLLRWPLKRQIRVSGRISYQNFLCAVRSKKRHLQTFIRKIKKPNSLSLRILKTKTLRIPEKSNKIRVSKTKKITDYTLVPKTYPLGQLQNLSPF